MALNEKYFISAPLDQYFVDKDTGLPLANGTIYFYRDSARTTPKAIYELSGTPPDYTYTTLPNPLTLSAVGTVQNNSNENTVIYYYPFEGTPDQESNVLDLYYVVCYNEDGIEQWTREGWPNITDANDPTKDTFPVQNQIANPQFSRVFINEGESTTYSVSSATTRFSFAPDWEIEVSNPSGAGSVTVQRIAVAGSSQIITSPPYVLDIQVAANTTCRLVQRMNKNSGLWASTTDLPIYLAGTIVGTNINAGDASIIMYYDESTGGSPVDILNTSVSDGEYFLRKGVSDSAIANSANTDTGSDGYIEIYIELAASTHVRLSSIQVVPSTTSTTASYDVKTSNREQALMGDYFIPRLESKPIDSLLTGWDFPLNPAQLGETGTIPAAAAAAYIWDQTIAVDLPGSATYARNADTGALQITTVGTNNAFYLMQYLSGKEAKKFLGTGISSNVFAYKGTAGSDVTMRVYMFRGSEASGSIPTLPTTLGTVATDGVFTLTAANWSEIERNGLGTAKATLNAIDTTTPDWNEINNGKNDYGFTGWKIDDNAEILDTDKIGVVVTFAYGTGTPVVYVHSVSATPGDIPTRPAAKTEDITLAECEYYYETSFPTGTNFTTSDYTNALHSRMNVYESGGAGTANNVYPVAFSFQYRTKKRAVPTVTVGSPTGNASNVLVYFQNGDNSSRATSDVALATHFTQGFVGTGGVFYYPINTTISMYTSASTADAQLADGSIRYHFVADARLGVV